MLSERGLTFFRECMRVIIVPNLYSAEIDMRQTGNQRYDSVDTKYAISSSHPKIPDVVAGITRAVLMIMPRDLTAQMKAKDASWDQLLQICQLTHCGLLASYGDKDLGQHWLR